MVNRFKLQKVFDCQDMPDEERRLFFDHYNYVGNDCAVEHCVGDTTEELNIYDKWLIENGAERLEEVIITLWW